MPNANRERLNEIQNLINMKRLLIILVCIVLDTFTYCQKPVIFNRQSVTINRNSSYVSINDLTYGYGLGSTISPYAKQYTGLTTMHGYQLNIYGLHIKRSLIAGLGTGVLFYAGGPLIPLYLDFRYIWSFKKISPFIYDDNGVLLNYGNLINATKMFINSGAGIKFKISGSIAANFAAGLFVQMGPIVSRDSFVNLKVGVIYKPGD
jgi:hypothetical protein